MDVAIIGAGLSGAATAWALTRRGRSVVLIEQFEPRHAQGSSHGWARIVRRAYGDALYVALTGRAFELWREVEHSAGVELLRMHGGLDFGPRRDVAGIAELLTAQHVDFEMLPADRGRGPLAGHGLRGRGDLPSAGRHDGFRRGGGRVRRAGRPARARTCATRPPAVSVDRHGVITLAGGGTVSAGTVVVAAGTWLGPLLGDAGRRCRR